jgi:hypothetical protein
MEIVPDEIIGRKIDLNTGGFLSPYFRDQVYAAAEAYSKTLFVKIRVHARFQISPSA